MGAQSGQHNFATRGSAGPLVWLFSLPRRGPKRIRVFWRRGAVPCATFRNMKFETMLTIIGPPGLFADCSCGVGLFGRGKISSPDGRKWQRHHQLLKKASAKGEDDVKKMRQDTAESWAMTNCCHRNETRQGPGVSSHV